MEEKKILSKIFQKRLDENKSLPKAQQFEHISKSEIVDSEYPYKRTTKRLVTIETGMCPECDSQTYCVDYHRGERVCPKCGYVFSNTVFETPRYICPSQRQNQYHLTWAEKQFLKSKNYHFVTEAEAWKKKQIEREIDVITSSLHLNKYSISNIKEIIARTNLKKLHSTSNITTIICGVSRYIMKNQERKYLVGLRFDRGVFKENLQPHDYNIIERNIEKIYGDTYAYRPKKRKKTRTHKKHSKTKT